jgi:hypothetical protein
MTIYVDAYHAHDLIIRRSITGILVILYNTPIRCISKLQKTVKTSIYVSESVASRIDAELILEIRYMLRSLGVAWDGPELMLGDNMSVVLNTTVHSSVLMEKHNVIAYHGAREAISTRIMRFAYIKNQENVNDFLTKPLSNSFLPQIWMIQKQHLIINQQI